MTSRDRRQTTVLLLVLALVIALYFLCVGCPAAGTNSATITVVGITHGTDDTFDVTYEIAASMTDTLSTVAWKAQASTNAEFDLRAASWFDVGPTNIINFWINSPRGGDWVSILATQTFRYCDMGPMAEFFRGALVRIP